MKLIDIVTNPKKEDYAAFVKKYPKLDEEILRKIKGSNIRIELHKHEKYIYLIFFIPEYIREEHAVKSIEVNVFFDKAKHKVTIFGFNTSHFFKKYKDELESISHFSFGSFIDQWLQIVLEDEARIIEHLLQDTKSVREEYKNDTNSTLIIRHLTSNLINITTLRLIINNQQKLLEHVETYIRDFEDSIVNYKRAYITEELEYAKEFCETLMNSINTKYQVKQNDTLYAYTKYTYIFFLAGAVFQIAYAFIDDPSPIKITFWVASMVTLLGTLLMFRRFG
ncbi:MAG: CorA family divalent cation transporter [Candidatus Roizmanbacteria bacterium]